MEQNRKTAEDVKLMDEIASILAVQNHQRNETLRQADVNKAVLEDLTSTFSDVLKAQDSIIEQLESGNELKDDLLDEIDAILNGKKETVSRDELKTINIVSIGDNWSDFVSNNMAFAQEHALNLSNPYTAMFSNNELSYFNREMIEKFDICRLDKLDYAFAAASGLITGLIDVLLVGTISSDASDSVLQSKVDGVYDKIVTKYAKLEKTSLLKQHEKAALASNPQNAEKIKAKFKNLISDVNNMDKKGAISFLEENHKVNYDLATSIVNNGKKKLEGLNPSNHHLFSLGHDPGIGGLLFGIIDQLTGKASFIDPATGKLTRVLTENAQKSLGTNPVERIINAVTNWFGHIMSDIAGSKTSKGRGAGLPIPGWESLQSLHFGKIAINGKDMDIAQVSEWMFKNGLDIRSFTAQAIPVVINECLVRLYWFFKQHFYYGKSIKESLPIAKSREVARLLLVATSTFSGTDFIHAFAKSGGMSDFATFIMTINIPGLADLGLRAVQNIRLEVQHRHHVEEIIDRDIVQEWNRILND